MMTEIKMPSGAILKVQPAPFAAARTLYQAVLEEAKGLKFDPEAQVDVNFFKDLFCAGLASKKIEAALAECFKSALYNDLKITNDIFEPVEAREDYIMACFEVAQENIKPFTKNLLLQYATIFQKMKAVQA